MNQQKRSLDFDRLDSLIKSGKGDDGFIPRISIRKDPSGGDRQLWCWHLPQGFTEFHGLVRLVPDKIAREEYRKALKERFRLDFQPENITCDAPVVPLPLVPVDKEFPKMTAKVDKPAEPSKLDDKSRGLDPAPLAISDVIPLAAKLISGQKIKVRCHDTTSLESFHGNLRTRLNGNELTKDRKWSVTKIYPQDEEYQEGDTKACLRVSCEGPSSRRQSVKATERVEETHTKVVERSVTVTAPDPVFKQDLTTAPIPKQDLAVARPYSYLPKDGSVAKEVLDLHALISGLDYDENCGDMESAMEKMWNMADGIKHYRDAKATTDRILSLWLARHFDGSVFHDEEFEEAWREIWVTVHGAILGQIEAGEALEKKARDSERKDYNDRLKNLRTVSVEQAAFLDLALKFFSEEDSLSPEDWKRINDKELPTLAKKILASN